LNGFIALARMKHQEEDPRLQLLNRVKTTVRDNLLQVELSCPSAELMAIMEHRTEDLVSLK
jgi:hypothetical protein